VPRKDKLNKKKVYKYNKMRLKFTLPVLFLVATSLTSEARRVRVRPVSQEQEEETIQYYAAEEPQEGEQRVVYISADQYNGLYGQQAAGARSSNNERESYVRASPKPTATISARTKESPKAPPVQTIRNYNKVNDDGSFTFGYEAADGSFKEETRGTDCVVRGKYGYVDPDGNKREFTYVSGNPCDPNAPKDDDEEISSVEEEKPDNGPANYPTRPVRPVRPVTVAPKPAVTLFQNTYAQEEEQPEPEQVLKPQPQHIRTRPVYITRPNYETEEDQPVYQRQRVVSTTPAPVIYKSPLSITPRPLSASTTQQPATTYRPQLLQVAVTPRPSVVYSTKQIPSVRPTAPTSLRPGGNLDFDAEFQKFQQENNIVAPTPSSGNVKSSPAVPQRGSPIYSSELIFDPSSGQYNTQLYQTLPQTEGEFTLNQKIQPYVHNPSRPILSFEQIQAQSPLYNRPLRPSGTNNQAVYQQQQAELQFQNSAQLYAQQQKARTQQQSPQQFYYVQPNNYQQQQQQQAYNGGQIDAFLRGHNIQF
jgi:hypothetical protein